MDQVQQATPVPTIGEPGKANVPTFYVSSFNVSATSNEAVIIGSEVYPTWAPDGAAQAPVTLPRVVIRVSPQSLKDLADILGTFVAKYESAYGELQTDYLRRKSSRPA